MSVISADMFATICFLALMQNGSGLNSKAPYYIEEKKKYVLEAGFEALGLLDLDGTQRVINYMETWNLILPDTAPKFVKERFGVDLK